MKNQKSVQLFEVPEIQSRIVAVRSVQVMLDRDLAVLYGVQTKVLNQAVKRNIERFPERFMFRLVESEMRELVTKCDRFENLKHSVVPMYAFTEQGVAMLSAVLRSKIAIDVSIRIMDAFVAMRRFAYDHAGLVQRVGAIELKQRLVGGLSSFGRGGGGGEKGLARPPPHPAEMRKGPFYKGFAGPGPAGSQCGQPPARALDGERPYASRKALLKCCAFAKPHSAAISPSGLSVSFTCWYARTSRSCRR